MRKVKLFDWGEEITFANESWFAGRILEIQGELNDTASTDLVFYVLNGAIRITFNKNTYEFNKGKTIFIKEGTNYTLINPAPTSVEVLQILRQDTQVKEIRDDFSGGSGF